MSESHKKKAAAISAVVAYLRQEEEAYAFKQLHAPGGMFIPAQQRALPNIWGMSGRQAHMQARTLMQMKALCR